VQISTVLTDHETTSIHRVVEEVRRASGCEVESTEIVGLVPRDALLRYAVEALKVKAFDPRTQVLEERLASLGEPAAPGNGTWQEGARAMVDAVGDVTPAPGGGSVSALAAALGAALGRMVAGITAQSLAKKLEKDPSLQGRLQEARGLEGEFSRFAGELLGWMAEDARAFEGVMAATKLPRDAAGRAEAIQKALGRAGWKTQDVDLWEINEAFAVVSIANNDLVGLDPARVNVNGGAVALGHPIGASGARILVTLLHAMEQRGARRGIAAACLGGGNGVALAVERV